MNMKNRSYQLMNSVFGLISLLGGLSTAQATNIIDTTYGSGAGSFELGSFVDNGGNFMSLPSGSTIITGWTVADSGNGIDWVKPPIYAVDSGSFALDLSNQALTSSSISTVIPTIVGEAYTLSFSAATIIGHTATGIVSAGSLINQPFAAAFSSNTSTEAYTPFSFVFSATSSLTTITFEATGAHTDYGPVIDSVNVVSGNPVPEPDTNTLLVVGFLAGIVTTYRRGSAVRRNNAVSDVGCARLYRAHRFKSLIG